MSVADMLEKHFDRSPASKNDVIRRTGIDRSTFYQILGEKRMATPVQFIRILNSLQLEEEERVALLRQYERESAGGEAFEKYEKVRTFLRAMSTSGDNAEENSGGRGDSAAGGAESSGDDEMADPCPEPVADMLRHTLQRGGKIKLRLLIPSGLHILSGIASVLKEAVIPGSTVEVDQLVSDWNTESESRQMILGFAEYMKLLKTHPGFIVRAYMTEDVFFHPEGTPYPFYILGEDTMVMFDQSGHRCAVIRDPVQIRDYSEHFDGILQKAKTVIESNQDMTELFNKMTDVMKNTGNHRPIYLFNDAPCLWLSTTREQEKAYFDQEDGLAYGELLRSMDIIEFTSEKRVDRLLSGRTIDEAGMSLTLREEDIPLLREGVNSRIGKNLFLINESVQPLPEDWVIYAFGDGQLIMAPFRDSSFYVCVNNWDFATDIYDWFATRASTVNPEM